MPARISILLTAVLTVAVLGTGSASASTPRAASAHVSGAPALLIILVILALLIIGVVAVVRFIVRKGRDAL